MAQIEFLLLAAFSLGCAVFGPAVLFWTYLAFAALFSTAVLLL